MVIDGQISKNQCISWKHHESTSHEKPLTIGRFRVSTWDSTKVAVAKALELPSPDVVGAQAAELSAAEAAAYAARGVSHFCGFGKWVAFSDDALLYKW